MKIFLLSVVLTCVQCFPSGDHVWSPPSQVSALDQATLLLSSSDDTTTHDNDPLDNLADLRDIHQFDLDLSNYTDHEAVESADTSNQLIQEFNDHFDILPGMDTRDYNDTGLFLQSEQLETNNDVSSILNPDLYEVVTSPADAEVNTYDEHLLDDEHFDEADQDGMDRKYFQLLENLHKKMHRNKNHNNANSEGDADIEIHEEDNDVMHPLISLTAVRANSMRLTITPKKYSENSMVTITLYHLAWLVVMLNDLGSSDVQESSSQQASSDEAPQWSHHRVHSSLQTGSGALPHQPAHG